MVSGTERRWLLLAFIGLGVLALFFAGSKLGSPANAEAESLRDNSEILVVPIQIEREKYGLAMVDTVGQTLWIYEINSMGPAHNRLRLLAARSWQYDRMLKQYNTAEPKPEQVRMLLEEELGKQVKEQVNEKQEGSDVNVADVNAVDVNVVEVNKPNE
jgi:ABC-type molybdate transport system ATPase subunit